MALRAIRTHRRHYRTDQLIGELLDATVTIQPGCHRRVHIPADRLAIHPSQGGHPPIPCTR